MERGQYLFLEANNLKPFLPKELGPVLNPKLFRTDKGGVIAEGYRVTK
jgi:hypothetical protein